MYERLNEVLDARGLQPLAPGGAICYSGYREGQHPGEGGYPSYEQISEDLHLLRREWAYLRLYDCSPHATTVLDAIRREGLELRVMLGMNLAAEQSNPNCPWGAHFDEAVLQRNRKANDAELARLIELAAAHPHAVFSVSIGNEAAVEWTDHLVSIDRLCHFAATLREHIPQPVTFCENYIPWRGKLEPLAGLLDFVSLHTYPVWEYRSIDEALTYTQQNFRYVADHYPDKPVVITEAGWTTTANGRGIEPHNASETLQARYFDELTRWTGDEGILTFVFEAFDEPWKGAPEPDEPEKHWGLFDVQRVPKLAVAERYPDRAAGA